MEKFKEFLMTLGLLIIGSIVVASGFIIWAISMDKVLVDFTTIKDVISQEYVTETNLTVKDLKISKSDLSITNLSPLITTVFLIQTHSKNQISKVLLM